MGSQDIDSGYDSEAGFDSEADADSDCDSQAEAAQPSGASPASESDEEDVGDLSWEAVMAAVQGEGSDHDAAAEQAAEEAALQTVPAVGGDNTQESTPTSAAPGRRKVTDKAGLATAKVAKQKAGSKQKSAGSSKHAGSRKRPRQ